MSSCGIGFSFYRNPDRVSAGKKTVPSMAMHGCIICLLGKGEHRLAVTVCNLRPLPEHIHSHGCPLGTGG